MLGLCRITLTSCLFISSGGSFVGGLGRGIRGLARRVGGYEGPEGCEEGVVESD